MGTLAISFVSSFVSVLFWREKSRGLLIPESSLLSFFHFYFSHFVSISNIAQVVSCFAQYFVFIAVVLVSLENFVIKDKQGAKEVLHAGRAHPSIRTHQSSYLHLSR